MGIEKSSELVVRQDNLPIQFNEIETAFLAQLDLVGLPSDGIFVKTQEREVVFRNIPAVLGKLLPQQARSSTYISKFLAATMSGLFDAALNYLWDETIQEIRKRAIQYDIGYFYDNATYEEKRKKLTGPDDITKLDDSELIQGARNIGLISELGFKHLDFIRFMRNWASAAHPNQNEISGLQLVSWLETCINEVISLPISTVAVEIKKLLGNIKQTQLTQDEAKQIACFFVNLTQQQANNLAAGFSGIFLDEDTSPGVRQNIAYLLPFLWGSVDESTRHSFGIKYSKFIASNEQSKAILARQFLEIVGGVSYLTDDIKIVEIDHAVQQLLSAHRNFNNFHTEPAFARQLAGLIGKTGNIPPQVRTRYVFGVIEVFLTNGNGEAWNASPYYIELINKFSQEEAIIALVSFYNENISSRLQFSRCKEKYKELLTLIGGKIISPAAKDILSAVESFSGPFEKLKSDTRIQQKTKSMQQILN